jgi:hypothetical protein
MNREPTFFSSMLPELIAPVLRRKLRVAEAHSQNRAKSAIESRIAPTAAFLARFEALGENERRAGSGTRVGENVRFAGDVVILSLSNSLRAIEERDRSARVESVGRDSKHPIESNL